MLSQTETRVPVGTLWAELSSVVVSVIQTETRVPIGTLGAGLCSLAGHSHSNENSRSCRNALGRGLGVWTVIVSQTETRVPVGTPWARLSSVVGQGSF